MKDEHQAEDVLQEAYIKAFNNLNTLQNANKFEAWLHKIIYTTAMDVYRKRKRQTEHSINFSDYEGENETSVEFEDDREEFKPEEQIDYQETQKAVLSFIDELSSPQRMAMVLFYYEQYSLKEIADVMECSVGTVKSAKTTKQKKETKTERQRRLEAYAKYLEGMDEDTRFYIADIAENQNPVLLIGTLEGTRGDFWPKDSEWQKSSDRNEELYSSYDVYGYQNGKVINISKGEEGGNARSLQLAKKGKDNYINYSGHASQILVGVRDNEIYKYDMVTLSGRGTSQLYKGDKVIKNWGDPSQEVLDEILNSFKVDYDHDIQFYKNIKENRDKYCK